MRQPGENIILSTDSYKQSHYAMYPPKTEYVGSYFESRAGGEYPETVFFGLQYLIKRYLTGEVVTMQKIREAKNLLDVHFGYDLFNVNGWEYIRKEHNGRLPIMIHSVPEGTVVPESNALFIIRNTDPKCAWLVNHLETLLVQLWYPSTVATISREQKLLLKEALDQTGSVDKLPFMLHDFGYRGSTSIESAALGGAAHLVNFLGTDTIAGMEMLRKYYNADKPADMPGFSVPAAEHSTITAWGEDNELEAYRYILDQFPSGLVSVVSDSWDIYNACDNLWGGDLAYDVYERDGTVVVRPDSGDPKVVVPKCLTILGDRFGYTVNDKGYKVLPDYIRLIQGDGISRQSLPSIVMSIISSGWSMDNIVFGSGGGLLQDCNRDTLRFAMKCNWATVDGKVREVYKQPASDPTKNSKRGFLKVVRDENGQLTTVKANNMLDTGNVMQLRFMNGEIRNETTLSEVRERVDV